eukprot:6191240-Pleurochrysis_carterae.AAC.1
MSACTLTAQKDQEDEIDSPPQLSAVGSNNVFVQRSDLGETETRRQGVDVADHADETQSRRSIRSGWRIPRAKKGAMNSLREIKEHRKARWCYKRSRR